MRNISICLISYEFPPRYGGEGTYTYSLFRALKAAGNKVKVIVPSGCYAPQHEDDSSILKVQGIKLPLMQTLTFSLLAYKIAAQIDRKEDIDIVHYTNDYVPILTQRGKISRPLVATIHHPHISEARAIMKREHKTRDAALLHTLRKLMLHQIQSRGLKKANRIIAVSRFAASEAEKVLGFPHDKLRVVMHGIDTNRFSPEINSDESRHIFSLSPGPTILYVGRLDYNKGLDLLIKAFALITDRVKDARLVLVGGYEVRGRRRLLEDAARLGVLSKITLLGPLSEQDLPIIYSAADVVVLPSLMEGFGLSLLEGMASGKPCVASQVGGTVEAIDHNRTGLLVPVGDVNSLASAISNVLIDKALSSRLGRAGREYALRNFTLEKMGLETTRVYREILN